MSYGVKYRAEFRDILSVNWRADIEIDGYSGSITTLECTGNPLSIELLSNGDDWYTSTVKGSTATLEVYDNQGFQFLSLYDYANLAYRVSIYYGDAYTLYWRGFINSEDYQEDYDGITYAVSIQAADGLGLLKNLPFKYTTTEEDDTYYNGRYSEAYIINEILQKVNITSFSEFINIYESTMLSGITDSPLIQTSLDADVFKDLNCYDVLSNILSKYGAVILQDRGQICIIRPEEMWQSTVYGRIFTSATGYTSTSIAPEQLVNRTATPSNFIVPNGGTLAIQPPAKKVTINQDYGYKSSLIDGCVFKMEDYDASSGTFPYWTNYNNIKVYTVTKQIPEEEDGVYITATGYTASTLNYISQEFGNNLIATDTTNAFSLSFDYVYCSQKTSNYSSLEADIALQIYDSTGTYWLSDNLGTGAVCTWSTSESWIYVRPGTITPGVGEWKTYSKQVAGIPINGPYTIKIFKGGAMNENIQHIVKNVKFIATADTIIKKAKRKSRWSFSPWWSFLTNTGSVKYQLSGPRKITGYVYEDGIDNDEVVEKEYVTSNDIKGVEINNDYLLGDVIDSNVDNIIEQFKGSISTLTLENAAAKAVSDNNDYYISNHWAVMSSSKNKIIYTAYTGGTDSLGNLGLSYFEGDIDAYVTHTQANAPGVKKIDTVTITGTTGSFRIYHSNIFDHYDLVSIYPANSTGKWYTRQFNNENKPLLEILGNSIQQQYIQPFQLLSVPMIEQNYSGNEPALRLSCNLRDSVNIDNVRGYARYFFINGAEFAVRNREWELDLVEIVTPYIAPSPTPSPSVTPSVTPSISVSRTPSVTPSISVSRTPSVTPSVTPSISISRTPSRTPSVTPSRTPSISVSRTPSVTPTITPSITPSISRTPSVTPSPNVEYYYNATRYDCSGGVCTTSESVVVVSESELTLYEYYSFMDGIYVWRINSSTTSQVADDITNTIQVSTCSEGCQKK